MTHEAQTVEAQYDDTKPPRRMRRWTDRYGRKWQCNAYDHGPFCRRCVRVSRLTPYQAAVRLEKLGWNQEHGRTDEGDYAVRIWSGSIERTFRSPYHSAMNVLYDEALTSVTPPRRRRTKPKSTPATANQEAQG